MMKSSFEVRASSPTSERTREKTAFERIGDQHELMMRYMRSLARPDRERGPLERIDPRKTPPKTYRDMMFKPDLYVVEPAAIDDLEAAKLKGNEKHIEAYRSVIRAMSWASHGRTDDKIASEIVTKFLRDAQARVIQGGFEYSDTEPAEWARVLNAFKSDSDCQGAGIEKPTRFVEKKVLETWKELLSEFRGKKKGSGDWPTSHPVQLDPPKLSEEVQRINDSLVDLRHVRDQLYFWRLYPKHCMYAKGK